MCKADDKKLLKRAEKEPKFKCKKCGSKAPKEKHLCQPEKI